MEPVERYIRARVPLVQVVSHEETRALGYLAEVSRRVRDGQPVEFFCWSIVSGLRRLVTEKTGFGQIDKKFEPLDLDPLEVLAWTIEYDKPALVVLLDYHAYLGDDQASVKRALREAGRSIKDSNKSIVLLQPIRRIPLELTKEMAYVELPLPDVLQLQARLVGCVKQLAATKYGTSLTDEDLEQIVQAGQGLTRDEFDAALSLALVENGCLDSQTVDHVAAEKRAVIKKTGVLEFYEPDAGMGDVGGMDAMKTWLKKRLRAFSNEAREFGLPQPKGMLLIGVQGCGKSLTAKAISALWKLPLLRLDVGSLFGGLVGESEANARHALEVAEAVSPCILWIDEIEKSLAGVQSSGSTDSGTTARVFSTILTWMNEKKAPVFVMATANRVQDLPPELMRKGRFDEIFFVDLPAFTERKEILSIHLKRRGRNPDEFDLCSVAHQTKGFSGAELEQLIIAGLYDAFYAERDLNQDDLLHAAAETVPLSTTMAEHVEYLRDWCNGRAVRASEKQEEPAPEASKSDIGAVFGGQGLPEA
jgi:SpoVK/Ycf46/Vps4 family AAA+-type ATPase